MVETGSSMLETILAHKRKELAARKFRPDVSKVVHSSLATTQPSFAAAISRPALNIIAEIKYRSPSRGRFDCTFSPSELATVYEKNGAAAISVLTDGKFFAGDIGFISDIRSSGMPLPLLRKDFIIDTSQILEARAAGASAFLLIAACLSPDSLRDLLVFGKDLSLDPLVEVHDPNELETALNAGAGIIGVNNRNLADLQVDVGTSFRIARLLEGERSVTLVSESGLNSHSQLVELRDAGFRAFLIGTSLMESNDPGRRLRQFLGNDHAD